MPYPIEKASSKESKSPRFSKYLNVACLLSPFEMAKLFNEIGSPYLVYSDQVLDSQLKDFSPRIFLENYHSYYESLFLTPSACFAYRKALSFTLSTQLSDYYYLELPNGRQLIKVSQPVIQSQFFTLHFDGAQKKFHPLAMGESCISWGCYFSFPQLVQFPHKSAIEEVRRYDPRFANASLFMHLQKALRKLAHPCRFKYQQTSINTHYKLGYLTHQKISSHQGLLAQGLEIDFSQKNS